MGVHCESHALLAVCGILGADYAADANRGCAAFRYQRRSDALDQRMPSRAERRAARLCAARAHGCVVALCGRGAFVSRASAKRGACAVALGAEGFGRGDVSFPHAARLRAPRAESGAGELRAAPREFRRRADGEADGRLRAAPAAAARFLAAESMEAWQPAGKHPDPRREIAARGSRRARGVARGAGAGGCGRDEFVSVGRAHLERHLRHGDVSPARGVAG